MSSSKITRWTWLLAIALAAMPVVVPAKDKDIVRLTIDLTDGTIVKGTTTLQKLPVRASMGDLEIPIGKIASVSASGEAGKVIIKLDNGDSIAGELRANRLDLEACFGSVAVPLDKVVKLKVAVEQEGVAKFDAAADFSAENNPTGAWSYGWCAKPAAEFHLYRTKDAKTAQQYPGLVAWTAESGAPCVAFNGGKEAFHPDNTITYMPGQFGFHPGPGGEYSVVRWTAAKSGHCKIAGAFTGISGYRSAPPTTTDVAVYHGEHKLFSSFLNLQGKGNKADFELVEPVEQGDAIDFVVGLGNGSYGWDSTGLNAKITLSPVEAK